MFWVYATLFSSVIVLANLITVEFIPIPLFPEFFLPCSFLIYPLAFLLSNLITEIYGEQKARTLVYIGFGVGFCSYFLMQIVPLLAQKPIYLREILKSLSGMQSLALLSSLSAYAVSQLLDIRLFGFLKEITKCKHLWLRNIVATSTSQIIETLAVNTLLLHCALQLDLSLVIKISVVCYLFKALLTVSNTPLFYLAVKFSNRFLEKSVSKKTLKLKHLES